MVWRTEGVWVHIRACEFVTKWWVGREPKTQREESQISRKWWSQMHELFLDCSWVQQWCEQQLAGSQGCNCSSRLGVNHCGGFMALLCGLPLESHVGKVCGWLCKGGFLWSCAFVGGGNVCSWAVQSNGKEGTIPRSEWCQSGKLK